MILTERESRDLNKLYQNLLNEESKLKLKPKKKFDPDKSEEVAADTYDAMTDALKNQTQKYAKDLKASMSNMSPEERQKILGADFAGSAFSIERPAREDIKGEDIAQVRYETLIPMMDDSYETNIPLIIFGDIGIGKTSIMRQFSQQKATRAGKTFIHWDVVQGNFGMIEEIKTNPQNFYIFVDIRLSQLRPEHMQGTPDIKHREETKWKPADWVHMLSHKNLEGIIFFDEILQAPLPMVNALYSLEERKVGSVRVSDDIRFFGASNLGRAYAEQKMKPGFADRFGKVYLAADPEQWLDWAEKNNVHPYVISFVRSNPGEFFQTTPEQMKEIQHKQAPSAMNPRALVRVSDTLWRAQKMAMEGKRVTWGQVINNIAKYTPTSWANQFDVFVQEIKGLDIRELFKNPVPYLQALSEQKGRPMSTFYPVAIEKLMSLITTAYNLKQEEKQSGEEKPVKRVGDERVTGDELYGGVLKLLNDFDLEWATIILAIMNSRFTSKGEKSEVVMEFTKFLNKINQQPEKFPEMKKEYDRFAKKGRDGLSRLDYIKGLGSDKFKATDESVYLKDLAKRHVYLNEELDYEQIKVIEESKYKAALKNKITRFDILAENALRKQYEPTLRQASCRMYMGVDKQYMHNLLEHLENKFEFGVLHEDTSYTQTHIKDLKNAVRHYVKHNTPDYNTKEFIRNTFKQKRPGFFLSQLYSYAY